MTPPFYDSDLTDAEWQIVVPLLPTPKPLGREREVDLREVLNAIFYRADNALKWRALPKHFPAWQTVYGYYRLGVRLGVWEQLNDALVRQVRQAEGREEEPSLVIIDSQSVKLGQKGGRNRESMATSGSRGANVTLSLTCWDWCWVVMSLLPM